MKRILLVNPRYEMEILRVSDEEHIDVKADNMPLGLATVAALTPDEYQVDIWDEFVHGPIEDQARTFDCDLVGVTSTRVTFIRAKQISAFFRSQGIPVVIGGPGVTGSPDRCRADFDILFIGEAELIWPQFLHDWQNGSHKFEYRQIEKPNMSLSPLPKWDSIADDVSSYAMGGVQTTRGCPYDCEFCDVVYLNGRIQRHKTVERVMEEVRALQRLGVSKVYFADDNLIGDHNYAKVLLRALIPYNNSLPQPLGFATQASIDAARDDELLELLADANFYEMLIGIESPNEASLREIGKYNNLKGNLVDELHKILSFGISVRGAFIGGLDHDDADIFDAIATFIEKSCLPSVSLHMLNAPIGTRLWRRLREEGRVLDVFDITDKVTRRMFSNVIPKRMTRVQLMEGFKKLYTRVFSWNSFRVRMLGFVDLAQRPPNVPQPEISPVRLFKLGSNMGLDNEACRVMDEIFRYTLEKAPFLIGRVKDLVIQFVKYSMSARKMTPQLQEQIELESSGKFRYKLDNRPVTVSDSFHKAYRSIFPDVYRSVYLNLTDKGRVADALMEVFVEFLVREEGFQTYEKYHEVIFREIVHRTCARANGQKFEAFVPIEAGGQPIPDFRKMRLHDEVLKSVEQELLKLVMKQPTAK